MTKNEKIIIHVCATIGLAAAVAAMFIVSVAHKQKTFADRWVDIRPVDSIPHEKLHARALEILQSVAPVVAETVPLPKPDPRKEGGAQ